jgi:hypothetical protein
MADCDWLSSDPLDRPGFFGCELGLLTMSYQAKTIGPALGAARNPAGDEYVGELPAAIADLVAETQASAAVLGRTASKANARDCGQSGLGACMDLRIEAWKAMNDMENALAAWAS